MNNSPLQDIELQHNVAALKQGNLNLWPLLRHRVYFEILNKRTAYSNKKRTRNKIQLLKNFFYGFAEIFKLRRFDYVCFENTNKRIEIDSKFFDVYFDALADTYGRDRFLFVEFASNKFFRKSKVHSKHIMSDLPFKLGCWICAKFQSSAIDNQQVLNDILNEYNIHFNVDKEIKKQLGEIAFYQFLFKFIKPKAIFVLSSFSKIAHVMAAKSLEIPVYEAQHGFIGHSHPFYSSEVAFPESYPDYLLAFGSYEKESEESIIFQKHQIIPIGGLELEHLESKPVPKALLSLKSEFSNIICLTMQALKEEELFGAVIDFAKENQDVLFVIRPKDKSIDYSRYTELKNIILLPDYTIYDVLKVSDYNITIFSTTAVEAPMLGAKTIFYNADGLSKAYFNIKQMGVVVIEENEKLAWKHLEDSKIDSSPYYLKGYFKNVQKMNLEL